ncbi:MAG: TolC family protein [Planctomycetota bacterium]
MIPTHEPSQRRSPTRLAVPLAALAIVGGCTHYTAQPLPGFEIFGDIDQARAHAANATAPVTLQELRTRLHAESPKIAIARARHATAAARAEIQEPWPDPSISIGPQLATSRDGGNSLPSLLASLNLRIPLGDRLAAATELDRVIAGQREIEAALVVREEELAMRREALVVRQAAAGTALRDAMLATAERAIEVGRRAIEVGSMTAGGFAALRRLLAEQHFERATMNAALATARCDLAARLGCNADAFGSIAIEPTTPTSLPGRDALIVRLAASRPALLRKRAEYAVAEANLRLEIAQQWPDLTLTPGFNDEPGEDRNVFALGLGITLPLFDGNQKNIAESHARRDQVREEYLAEVRMALADLDRSLVAATNAERNLLIAREQLVPAAESAFDAARLGLEAGATTALDVIDALRGQMRAHAAVLDAETAWLTAVSSLEFAIGDAILELESDSKSEPDDSTTSDQETGH